MAQCKKDAIRDGILSQSLLLFKNKGYIETSIKDIAEACGISVGNVYKYYKSKAEIYEHIITDEFLEELHDILSKRTMKFAELQLTPNATHLQVWFDKEYYPFFVENQDKLIILHDHYIGQEYDNRVNVIADNIISYKKKAYEVYGNIVLNKEFLTFSNLIFKSNITMYFHILEMDITKEQKIKLLKQFDVYHRAGIDKIFKELIK
ncbi:MAG: TetR/AcrR family transcriptional regulator [Clostridia bacterium]|nr:TetR/AcrR family transcriptional regulator [Clostridia bacterium]